MRLPELGLQITDMHFFTKKCNYQPFMKIFNTDMMSEQDIARQSGKRWSSGSEPNVVKRTVNLGME